MQQPSKMLLQHGSKNTANIEISKLCNLYKTRTQDIDFERFLIFGALTAENKLGS
jgi:hypothetical protein